jgi:hypothetical protein
METEIKDSIYCKAVETRLKRISIGKLVETIDATLTQTESRDDNEIERKTIVMPPEFSTTSAFILSCVSRTPMKNFAKLLDHLRV